MSLPPLPACLSYPTPHAALSTTNWLRSEWSSLQPPFFSTSSRVFRVRLSDSLSACRRTYAALTTNLHSRRLAKATSRLDFNYNNSNFDFEPSRVRERERERGEGEQAEVQNELSHCANLAAVASLRLSLSLSLSLGLGLGLLRARLRDCWLLFDSSVAPLHLSHKCIVAGPQLACHSPSFVSCFMGLMAAPQVVVECCCNTMSLGALDTCALLKRPLCQQHPLPLPPYSAWFICCCFLIPFFDSFAFALRCALCLD